MPASVVPPSPLSPGKPSRRRSAAGLPLRVGGVIAGLFAVLMLIGTIGALSQGSYGVSGALGSLLVVVVPAGVLAWLLFRAAGKADARARHPQQAPVPTHPAQPPQALPVRHPLTTPAQPGPVGVGAVIGDASRQPTPVSSSPVRTDATAAAREREAALQAQRDRDGYLVGGEWYPPKPVGSLIDAWAVGSGVEIVGESHHADAFQRIMGRRPGFRTYDGAETQSEAVLVPDPSNPYGRGRAVAVYVDGRHVGNLAQEDAARYFPVLAPMRAGGTLLRAPARVWARSEDGTVCARVTLTLPEPSGLHPSNGLPTGPFAVIPPGRAIQVTKEDEHMDVLASHVLRGAGEANYVAVMLRSINEIRTRSSYEAVQVEIDGERVGVLSKIQSDKLLPLVKHIEERGMAPVARGVVTGTRLRAEVVLHCATADMVDDDWIDDLGDAVTTANVNADHTTPPARPDFDWDDEKNL